jgi:outer membrane protein assembly factor BamB
MIMLKKYWLSLFLFLAHCVYLRAEQNVEQVLSLLPDQRGMVAVLGLPESGPDFVTKLATAREWTIYFQSANSRDVEIVRKAAEQQGLLGKRIFADLGSLTFLHLSHNLIDLAIVTPSVVKETSELEVLRVLRPDAIGMMGDKQIRKAIPEGMDDWSHPYHGPDNNTQSKDKLVRGQFETQFIADPMFSPMPEQTVIAGGRMFKAMGHIAHKANQNEMLNTLLCINAYNGSWLWRRPLSEGFMLHRNTMIATEDALYLGDHESCKVIDAKTGKTLQEFTIQPDLVDGPVWKWMAIQGDVLYGLVGNLEVEIETVRSSKPGLGHWPWGMWKGHDFSDPRTAFGYGRTFVALDRKTGKLLWHYRDDEFLDSRSVCMKNDRIYCGCAEKFLMCLDANTGKVVWKNSDQDLLEAIGPNEKAQHYITGYSTTCYMKCNDDSLFLAGPQRKRMVVASTKDGKLQWTNEVGNLQLVLRENGIYAAGPEKTQGMVLDYKSGSMMAELPARRACTRATGCADSIFFRATGGTVRIMTEEANRGEHIAPMRPPCQDGVLISNGHLYWGPWMCGCQLSLYGNIGLRPAGDRPEGPKNLTRVQLASLAVYADSTIVESFPVRKNDWTVFRASNDRSDTNPIQLLSQYAIAWKSKVVSDELPTAPVAAGGFVFVADRTGIVRAFRSNGELAWKTYTAGAIYYPPVIANDRLFIGCADGRVYAMEAKTGRLLWTFQVAPEERWIPMYGKLVSRWPVAGGVVVEGGKVFAAAGITHYDGTYVVALDAITGKLLARNDSSGQLSEQVDSGISMQGELSIVDRELRFPGGGIYEIARYDLDSLRCLNDPKHNLFSEYRTAFYPWYPSYDRFVSFEKAMPDGSVLSHDAAYDGSAFGNLSLETPRPLGAAAKLKKDLAGEFLRRRGKTPPTQYVWTDQQNRRCTGFAVCNNTLLATGHLESQPDQPFLTALQISDGAELWKIPLPSDAVKGGIAVDAESHIYVTLENGELLSFQPPKVPSEN